MTAANGARAVDFRSTPAPRPTRRALRRAVVSLCALAEAPDRDAWLRVLTYHRVNPTHPADRLTVTPRAFEEQMRFLSSEHRVVRLSSAVARLRSGCRDPSAVAVTFDDGYRDNVDYALELLDRYRVPATFFLVSGNLGSMKSIDRYDECCQEDGTVSVSEARELLRRGHDVGAHGRTHRELAGLSAAEALREIVDSRNELERALGRRPELFCYPRGSETESIRRMVEASGFTAAVTVSPGANGPERDAFALSRTEISGDDDEKDFRMKLEGRFDPWHHWWQRLERARRRRTL